MDTAVEQAFGDGTYRFWLPLPQVFEIERKTGVSLFEIEEKLRAAMGQSEDGEFAFVGGGSAMLGQVIEVLRCGLIGGDSGMVDGEEIEVGPILAKQLVDQYAYPARPLGETAAMAYRVVHAAVFGIKLAAKKKPKAKRRSGTNRSPKGS